MGFPDGYVYPMAERMGVEIQLPTISPQPYTRKAFLGLQYAAEHDKGSEYVDAVLRAFFQQDRNIGQTDVLKAILPDIGLDPDGLDAVLASPEHGKRHDAALQQAREARISSVPSIAVDERILPRLPSSELLRAEILQRQG